MTRIAIVSLGVTLLAATIPAPAQADWRGRGYGYAEDGTITVMATGLAIMTEAGITTAATLGRGSLAGCSGSGCSEH